MRFSDCEIEIGNDQHNLPIIMNSEYAFLPPIYDKKQMKIVIAVGEKFTATCAIEYPEMKRKRGEKFLDTLTNLTCHSGDQFIDAAHPDVKSTFDSFLCKPGEVSQMQNFTHNH